MQPTPPDRRSSHVTSTAPKPSSSGRPRGRGRPPKDSGEDVREAILDAATDLFAERGFAATPVNAVCERAGVGKPAVYWHFESKQGLLAAVLERLDQRWREENASTSRPESAASGTEQLDAVIAEWRRRVLAPSAELWLPMSLQLDPGNDDNARVVSRLWAKAERGFAEGIRQAVGRDLPDLDLVGHTAVTLLHGAMHRYELDKDVEELDRMLAGCKETILLLIADRMRRADRELETRRPDPRAA